MQGNQEKSQLLEHLLVMSRGVADRVLEFRHTSSRIEVAVLAMSALTAGSLWVLISEIFVEPSKWIGAITATALAFLTSYKALGPSRLLDDARALHREIGVEIAALRSSTGTDMSRHWDALKRFETKLLDLGGHPKPPPGLTREEQEQLRQQSMPQ